MCLMGYTLCSLVVGAKVINLRLTTKQTNQNSLCFCLRNEQQERLKGYYSVLPFFDMYMFED